MLCCGDNLEKLLNEVHGELEKMKSWFNSNKLTRNLSKNSYMIFGNRPTQTNDIIMIHDVETERASVIIFLGVMIDDKLNWKSHINYVKSKMFLQIKHL